ncbi:hypothetical protein HanOQP8_Chr02g0043421 [Helianthus annuus]|nr:hypothetical protein HanOQP8_Chr02g0043421 [Helianthus annuus]
MSLSTFYVSTQYKFVFVFACVLCHMTVKISVFVLRVFSVLVFVCLLLSMVLRPPHPQHGG